MRRALLAACCLVGLIVGGGLAPAAGIQTPVPDLGVEGEAASGGDGGLGGEGESSSSLDAGLGANESAGVRSYGGVSAGGYPEQATVGGRLELSDREELVIESPRPSRWRLGAYPTYTGDGWERDRTSREPLSSPIPAVDADQPAYEIDVRARRSFDALVTVNRPAFATVDDRQVFVDDQRALTVDEPIRAGDTYTTLTYGPVPSASAAVASDDDYPDAIQERYTQLPEDTPDRLGNRTDNITADAETPYESAVAIRDWLEANKDYSLNASHERGNDVATAFVFEMEAGYCQYFATSMVAMLRTQGIPARYVTGYGPGERVGEDEYRVRGENAHAWVEVYITDVGWVTFDPTPAEGRAEAGRDPEPLDDLGDDWNRSDDVGNETADDLTRQDESGSPVAVTLSDTPIPGRTTAVVVTRQGAPIARVDVLFEGERIGKTSRGGAVIGTVPYAETLSVKVLLSEGSPRVARTANTSRTLSSYSTDSDAVVEYPLPTTIAIDTVGEPAPGEPIEVVATLQGVPVADAEVRVDGEQVATTDERGGATVDLPDAERADVVVERGAARGERTVDITSNETADDGTGPLSVSVAPEGPAPLPYTSTAVRVTYENEPVPNATVTVDGNPVAKTDADGTAVVRLPLSDPVIITAAAPEGYATQAVDNPLGETASAELGGARLTGTARIGGIYRNTAVALGVGVGLLGGLVGVGRRRDLQVRQLFTDRDELLAEAIQSVLGGIVGIGAAADSTLIAARRRLERGVGHLTDGREGIATLGVALASGLGRHLGRLSPRALLGALRDGGPAGTESGAVARRPTVREAWNELRAHASVPSWRTSTPGEIARWAVQRDGLPEDAVETLLAAFREVEYGNRPPQEGTAAIEEAIERIREATADEGSPEP